MEPIWHATKSGEPDLPGDEGFVHASFASQLTETLELHFKGAERLTLLRLDPDALGARLVIEPSRGGQSFPHVYGPIGPDDILDRMELRRDPDGRFDLIVVTP